MQPLGVACFGLNNMKYYCKIGVLKVARAAAAEAAASAIVTVEIVVTVLIIVITLLTT